MTALMLLLCSGVALSAFSITGNGYDDQDEFGQREDDSYDDSYREELVADLADMVAAQTVTQEQADALLDALDFPTAGQGISVRNA